MIKEKKKNSKYNFTKTKTQIITEYIRTIAISFFIALIITAALAMHARNEMIKNLYANTESRASMDKELARQIIQNTDLMTDLRSRKYNVCLHIGELYETAGDYEKAQYAYEIALKKAKTGVYTPYYKLICVLTAQNKISEAENILKNIEDCNEKTLIKFKTRSYIVIGDKYYSIGKFLSAAKNYEKAEFYYNKFSKKDEIITESIKYRIVNSYIETADIMVKTGLNSEAVRYLKRAENYYPKDYRIRYKLAIIYSDSNPELSVKYLEPLLEVIPQDIDSGVYGSAFLKAANIADLDGRSSQAKYYRYKVHSIDLFVNRKVVYKNDIEANLLKFNSKKKLFTYPLSAVYSFTNVSNSDINKLSADFVLTQNGKPLETVTKIIASKDKPLISYSEQPNITEIAFKRKIFTRKELEQYSVDIYLYKDKKYKTHTASMRIPIVK